MNALPKPDGHFTVEEYLAFEETSDVKHEYVNGEVYGLAGACEAHQLVLLNIATALLARVREVGGSRVLLDGMKLQVADSVIYYPDVMVNCDPADDDPYVKQCATVIVEILSPTSSSTDRREKAMLYLQMPTLLCYMIVYQDAQRVDLHWRPDAGSPWFFEIVIGRPVKIPDIDLELPLDNIYEGVKTDPSALIQ